MYFWSKLIFVKFRKIGLKMTMNVLNILKCSHFQAKYGFLAWKSVILDRNSHIFYRNFVIALIYQTSLRYLNVVTKIYRQKFYVKIFHQKLLFWIKGWFGKLTKPKILPTEWTWKFEITFKYQFRIELDWLEYPYFRHGQGILIRI